jgi:hypothetical protein
MTRRAANYSRKSHRSNDLSRFRIEDLETRQLKRPRKLTRL